MADPTVQPEGSFEVMADETIKTASASNSAQIAADRQMVNNVALQALQNAVVATDLLTKTVIENVNLAAKRSLDHWDNAKILHDTATGAAADAMIDQSPPDEGVRQAKTE